MDLLTRFYTARRKDLRDRWNRLREGFPRSSDPDLRLPDRADRTSQGVRRHRSAQDAQLATLLREQPEVLASALEGVSGSRRGSHAGYAPVALEWAWGNQGRF